MRADAGTIYLRAGDQLYFSFIENDALFLGQTDKSRYVYSANSLTINRNSLAGYVAETREPLVITDESGKTVLFSYQDRSFAIQFAHQAADALGRNRIPRARDQHL